MKIYKNSLKSKPEIEQLNLLIIV